MARGFSIMDMMNEMSSGGVSVENGTVESVNVHDIQMNDNNFYGMSNIEQLKNSIYAMGGVRQNVIVARIPGAYRMPYRAVSGHRRIRACLELVGEGHGEFQYIPAVVLEGIDRDTEEMLLVMTNSTQRELTDWERVMQHMKLREIIPKLKKLHGLDGRVRSLEADYLGVSEGQIAVYNTIGTRLDTWLMSVFRDGGIGISLAYEAARLEPELQAELGRISADKGGFTTEDIKCLLGSRSVPGQMTLVADGRPDAVVPDKKIVTESVTPEKDVEMADTGTEIVTESATPGVQAAAEKKEPCYTDSRDDVDSAVQFIFRMGGDFPEDILRELFMAVREGQDIGANSTAAENIFYRMLPYENQNVRVTYRTGYQVEYIHTGEVDVIPVYYFWKGFAEEFAEELAGVQCTDKGNPGQDGNPENVTESDTSGGDMRAAESVTGPDTSDRHPAAGDDGNGKRLKLRGGYGPAMVDSLIRRYGEYLELLWKDSGLSDMVSEYNCLLDALGLLRERIAMAGECDTYENGND